MRPPTIPIPSKKITIRPYRKGDERSLQKSANNKAVARYMSTLPSPYRIKDAKEWVVKCLKEYKEKKQNGINMAIVNEDRQIIGGIGLSNIEKNHKAEIGYWLNETYWGKGIITIAVRALTTFGFEKLKLKRLYAHVFSQNKASMRVLEKAGYKREGVLKKHHKKNTKYYDSTIYAKLK